MAPKFIKINKLETAKWAIKYSFQVDYVLIVHPSTPLNRI